jgi:hypothetical protein
MVKGMHMMHTEPLTTITIWLYDNNDDHIVALVMI